MPVGHGFLSRVPVFRFSGKIREPRRNELDRGLINYVIQNFVMYYLFVVANRIRLEYTSYRVVK